MKSLEITTHSPEETQKIACLLARELLRSHINTKGALVIALEGDLGGGKTTFSQGFARGLGIREKVLSPTFVIMRSHNMRKSNFHIFVHMDAYRVEHIKELRVLGWRGIIQDTKTIILIEWADKIKKSLPKEHINIQFEFVSENERKITMQNANVRQHKK